jgi:3-phosphoshikimate 1-carboxyvinyltransferase
MKLALSKVLLRLLIIENWWPVTHSITLEPVGQELTGTVQLPLSKSLSNRALVLAAQFPHVHLSKLSTADDTRVLQQALTKTKGEISIGAAGTAMRFLAAYFAAKEGTDVILTGSERMKQRPIGILVDALKSIGANITYPGITGFPPLAIKGQKLSGGDLFVESTRSSQFISALMLIGPALQSGLGIHLVGEVVSKPYVSMTAGLMNQLGFRVEAQNEVIRVHPQTEIHRATYTPEADWSAAAYWYGLLASAHSGELLLEGLEADSLQGDKRVAQIFAALGIKTTFTDAGVRLQKRPAQRPGVLIVNLIDHPDLAQPIAFTCAALGIGADLRGLQTLRFKETDRLAAIKKELAKVGVEVNITDHSLSFEATSIHAPIASFQTYTDHRMAMSAAILATRFPVTINHPEVVSKSYPGFWEELASILQGDSERGMRL